MPTDTDVAVDNPDAIDSNCHANPLDADGPTDVWCGNDAVTWIHKPAGHRVYLCREHAEQMKRFGDDPFELLEDPPEGPTDQGGVAHPTAVVCKRCRKFTPRHRVNVEKVCEECQVEA